MCVRVCVRACVCVRARAFVCECLWRALARVYVTQVIADSIRLAGCVMLQVWHKDGHILIEGDEGFTNNLCACLRVLTAERENASGSARPVAWRFSAV